MQPNGEFFPLPVEISAPIPWGFPPETLMLREFPIGSKGSRPLRRPAKRIPSIPVEPLDSRGRGAEGGRCELSWPMQGLHLTVAAEKKETPGGRDPRKREKHETGVTQVPVKGCDFQLRSNSGGISPKYEVLESKCLDSNELSGITPFSRRTVDFGKLQRTLPISSIWTSVLVEKSRKRG